MIRRTLSGWTKEEDQLWDAARDGKDGEIRRLIDAGTHVDCAHPRRSDTTPLMTAARYANLSSVKLLVRYGADVNMKSRWGRTALDDARKYTKQPRIMDKRNVVAFLEDAGQVAAEREKGAAEKEAKVAALKGEKAAAKEESYMQRGGGRGTGPGVGGGRRYRTPQRGDTSASGAAARTAETTGSRAAEDGGC
jgi:hypothetical protein